MSILHPSSRLLDEIRPGQLVAVSGVTGSGRTALARAIGSDLVRRGHRLGVVSAKPSLNEFLAVSHDALEVQGDRHEVTAVIYDYGNTARSDDSYASSVARDISAGRVVIVVSQAPAMFASADIRVVVGRPSRRLFAEVFGVAAPADGVPAPSRGTAFVAPRDGLPVLITFNPS